MLATAADRREYRKADRICCLAIIIAGIVCLILGIFIKDIVIVAGIAVATFIGSCCLLMLFFDREEIKEVRARKKKQRLAKLYPTGVPRAPVSSPRQTDLIGAPSKIVCQVCGATYETFVNFCEKCGAKMK